MVLLHSAVMFAFAALTTAKLFVQRTPGAHRPIVARQTADTSSTYSIAASSSFSVYSAPAPSFQFSSFTSVSYSSSTTSSLLSLSSVSASALVGSPSSTTVSSVSLTSATIPSLSMTLASISSVSPTSVAVSSVSSTSASVSLGPSAFSQSASPGSAISSSTSLTSSTSASVSLASSSYSSSVSLASSTSSPSSPSSTVSLALSTSSSLASLTSSTSSSSVALPPTTVSSSASSVSSTSLSTSIFISTSSSSSSTSSIIVPPEPSSTGTNWHIDIVGSNSAVNLGNYDASQFASLFSGACSSDGCSPDNVQKWTDARGGTIPPLDGTASLTGAWDHDPAIQQYMVAAVNAVLLATETCKQVAVVGYPRMRRVPDTGPFPHEAGFIPQCQMMDSVQATLYSGGHSVKGSLSVQLASAPADDSFLCSLFTGLITAGITALDPPAALGAAVGLDSLLC